MFKCARIQGFKVNLLSFDEAVQYSLDLIKNSNNLHLVTIKPEIIQTAKKKPGLKKIINKVGPLNPDEVGIKN